jgi:hypothetical protein
MRPEAGNSDGAKDNSSMKVNPEKPRLRANFRFPGDTDQGALKCIIFCFTRLVRTTFPGVPNFGNNT